MVEPCLFSSMADFYTGSDQSPFASPTPSTASAASASTTVPAAATAAGGAVAAAAMHHEDSPPSLFEGGRVEVAVSEPIKRGDGINSHMVYTVVIKVRM
jgi:hypothetical protein